MPEPERSQNERQTPGPERLRDAGLLELAQGRLGDRGIDPGQVIGTAEDGQPLTVAGFYTMLGFVSATEKAGQHPTSGMARLALHARLPQEIADTLFLAYNQQSAEEASHGDKVFGSAYYQMGGVAVDTGDSAVGTQTPGFIQPGEDPKENKKRLGSMAGFLGGIETVALNRVFPVVVRLCEAWDHPIARDLHNQIRDNVRPEESRHVLTFRYVFQTLIAPKGERVIDAYYGAFNAGRQQLGSPPLDREAFERLVGGNVPTQRQLLGKERVGLA